MPVRALPPVYDPFVVSVVQFAVTGAAAYADGVIADKPAAADRSIGSRSPAPTRSSSKPTAFFYGTRRASATSTFWPDTVR